MQPWQQEPSIKNEALNTRRKRFIATVCILKFMILYYMTIALYND